jgi:hypothetical protein
MFCICMEKFTVNHVCRITRKQDEMILALIQLGAYMAELSQKN